ncbi:unnamed protein product [Aureobasidium vineae]|uniref:Uncharacterized protein n=1 Tax=Aureobasidium vineae TaxID=2773715 RepID=A0A9N8K0Y3_9PEZI|nr:unnamed protein product [Aureobasidium vineae]
MLTNIGSCLIKQMRDEEFLPRSMFRMDDIVEVGGAVVRLNNGKNLSPNTQIRFLGSYYPAIIIKIVYAPQYEKAMSQTRQAIQCMNGRLRVVIIIKIEKTSTPPTATEQPGMQSGPESSNTIISKQTKMSEIHRITATLLQLGTTHDARLASTLGLDPTHDHDLVAMYIHQETEVFPQATQKTFVFDWRCISPDPWQSTSPMPYISLSLSPLSELAQKYMEEDSVMAGRYRTLDHVDYGHKVYWEFIQGASPPAEPSQE